MLNCLLKPFCRNEPWIAENSSAGRGEPAPVGGMTGPRLPSGARQSGSAGNRPAGHGHTGPRLALSEKAILATKWLYFDVFSYTTSLMIVGMIFMID